MLEQLYYSTGESIVPRLTYAAHFGRIDFHGLAHEIYLASTASRVPAAAKQLEGGGRLRVALPLEGATRAP